MIYFWILLFDSMTVAGCILTTTAGIDFKIDNQKPLYIENEYVKLGENGKMVYYKIPDKWKAQIAESFMAIFGILIATSPSIFSEYIPKGHVAVLGRLIFIPILAGVLIAMGYFFSRICAKMVCCLVGKWAKKHGITKKAEDGKISIG